MGAEKTVLVIRLRAKRPNGSFGTKSFVLSVRDIHNAVSFRFRKHDLIDGGPVPLWYLPIIEEQHMSIARDPPQEVHAVLIEEGLVHTIPRLVRLRVSPTVQNVATSSRVSTTMALAFNDRGAVVYNQDLTHTVQTNYDLISHIIVRNAV